MSAKNAFEQLVDLVRKLRSPEGCPHDRSLTMLGASADVSGEALELEKAIDRDDINNIKEEIGDTIFNLILVAVMAEEAGQFTIEDVLVTIHDKIVRRHPHVFGNAKASTPEEADALFKLAKAQERMRQWPKVLDVNIVKDIQKEGDDGTVL